MNLRKKTVLRISKQTSKNPTLIWNGFCDLVMINIKYFLKVVVEFSQSSSKIELFISKLWNRIMRILFYILDKFWDTTFSNMFVPIFEYVNSLTQTITKNPRWRNFLTASFTWISKLNYIVIIFKGDKSYENHMKSDDTKCEWR